MNNRLAIVSWFSLLILLFGCTVGTSGTEPANEPLPIPTTFPFFEPEEELINRTGLAENTMANPTVASLFRPIETPLPRPTRMPGPTLEPFRPTVKQPNVFMATIFDDALSSEWEILEGTGAVIDTESKLRVYEGEKSIAFTPEVDYSTLFFTVKDGTEIPYKANEVVGVSFWINGGDDFIHLDQLSVAVIGSNRYNYWVADDNSVQFPVGETFSETRLYFMNLNRSIPPETWVELYLQLDTLIYDPYYDNVVGFYLKNDEGFRNTVYMDEVNLVMAGSAEERALATPAAPASSDAAPTGEPAPQAEPDGTATPTVTTTPESAACAVSPPVEWELHSIQPGETISGLASAAGIYPNYALSVNCLEADGIVSVGQEIWLPPQPAE